MFSIFFLHSTYDTDKKNLSTVRRFFCKMVIFLSNPMTSTFDSRDILEGEVKSQSLLGLKVLDWFLSCCSPHCQIKFQNHFAYLYLAFIKKLKKTVRCYFTFYSLLIGFRFFYVIISCKRALYQRVQLVPIVSVSLFPRSFQTSLRTSGIQVIWITNPHLAMKKHKWMISNELESFDGESGFFSFRSWNEFGRFIDTASTKHHMETFQWEILIRLWSAKAWYPTKIVTFSLWRFWEVVVY